MSIDISPACPHCGYSMNTHRALGGRCPRPYTDVVPMNDAALEQMEKTHGPAPQQVKDQVSKIEKFFGI
jgi:hypothetical protein